ncbi:MAG: alkaline phosphatase family protein [Acidimicrobiales bacterium]
MKIRSGRLRALVAGIAVLGAVSTVALTTFSGGTANAALRHADRVFEATAVAPTTTPIKHVVVIFDENVSFDHYFATYPDATNTDGEPFYAAPGTPSVNGLSGSLLTDNPNGINPVRLDPDNVNNVLTCDQDHNYTPEQEAADNGAEDMFPTYTATATGSDPEGQACTNNTVMDYYDGNVVTAEWNYAQHFALSDNNYGSTYGPSTQGALNVTSGNTGEVDTNHVARGVLTDGDAVTYTNPDGSSGTTLIADAQPYWDDCSTGAAAALNGENIGDQLNAKNLSWGWFQGGFTPTTPYSGPVTSVSDYNQLNNPDAVTCTSTSNVGAALRGTGKTGANPWGTDSNYSAHYDGFQFYASTANPHHLAPTSLSVVGTDTATPGEFDTANHNYDVSEFNDLVSAIQGGTLPATNFPAVSYLKAPVYETGHPATSDPIDEQNWLVSEINSIESLPTWKSTAIFVTYDDSDGWYDHVYAGVSNPSDTTADALTGADACGTVPAPGQPGYGTTPVFDEQGRCGEGPRLPLLVISPWAKQDYVSNVNTDQSSIIAFIEQNWGLGQIPGSLANTAGSLDDLFNFSATPSQLAQPLVLSPTTGEPSYPVEGTISPSTGPSSGGTTVTINGMNFSTTGGTSVKFGNGPATDVTCTPSSTLAAPATTCTVTAPKGAAGSAVPVTVTVGTTRAVDDAGEYTYSNQSP